MYGPSALAEIFVDAPGRYNLLIVYRNPHEGQRLTLRQDGSSLGTYELPNTGWHSSRILVQELTLNCRSSVLQIEAAKWYSTKEDERPLAIIVTEIMLEKIVETLANHMETTSHH
jgi:hypothetical protein